jgi:hypothetical protein
MYHVPFVQFYWTNIEKTELWVQTWGQQNHCNFIDSFYNSDIKHCFLWNPSKDVELHLLSKDELSPTLITSVGICYLIVSTLSQWESFDTTWKSAVIDLISMADRNYPKPLPSLLLFLYAFLKRIFKIDFSM